MHLTTFLVVLASLQSAKCTGSAALELAAGIPMAFVRTVHAVHMEHVTATVAGAYICRIVGGNQVRIS